jgi:hypothetical protein
VHVLLVSEASMRTTCPIEASQKLSLSHQELG